jgi:hypothetical protein
VPLDGTRRKEWAIPQGKCKIFWSFNTIREIFLVNFSTAVPRSEGGEGTPKGNGAKILPGAIYIRVEISRCL